MSWILKVTLAGQAVDGGKPEGVLSYAVSWHVDGRERATSRSHIPVPAPTSATLSVGDVTGMFGWMRKPRILVVVSCCSSSLFWGGTTVRIGIWADAGVEYVGAYLSGISSMESRGSVPRALGSSIVLLVIVHGRTIRKECATGLGLI